MMSRLPTLLLTALFCVLAANSAQAATDSPACAAAARRPTHDPRIAAAIDEARRQHLLFGGQTIERNGGIFRVGHHEAEWDSNPGDTTGAWQRVAGFWQALSPTDPPHVITSGGRVERADVLRETVPQREATAADTAVREALLRAAIVDTPWSAAFISYLMKAAGFSPTEFAFSDTHADYVQAALGASAAEADGRPADHAFRACDVATTPPRAGDLLCSTRAGKATVARFDALVDALAVRAPGEPFPMHCELVVRADQGGDAKLDTIGGNVIQSVTLTRMTLNADKRLGSAYIRRTPPPTCGAQPCRGHLGRRPWVVLLQARN